MPLKYASHQEELRSAGWRSRGYLPHFDGQIVPQFLTLRLADSMPLSVLEGWQRELAQLKGEDRRVHLQNRIEKYLDMGYGETLLRDPRIGTLVQDSLLKFDERRYRLHAWVIMPNHLHCLMTRVAELEIEEIMKRFKGYTARQANKVLARTGQFWVEDYFDRWMRNEKHFRRTISYIELNPVKARLCSKPEDWPFSSAWYRRYDEAPKR